MSELTDRLRRLSGLIRAENEFDSVAKMLDEAADEIERLDRKNVIYKCMVEAMERGDLDNWGARNGVEDGPERDRKCASQCLAFVWGVQ